MQGLSDKEFINRLDLESTDPVVRRLLAILGDNSIRLELEEVGMDHEDCTFSHDWQNLSPGEYIEQLRKDIDYCNQDLEALEQEKLDLEREVNRLSTISLVKFIGDVSDKLDVANSEMHRHRRIAEQEKKLREEAEQKFEFWEKLNYGGKGRA